MRYFCLLTLSAVLLGSASLVQDESPASEKDAVAAVIESSYITPLYLRGDLDKIAEGLHPEFRMYYLHDDAVAIRLRDTWIERLRERRDLTAPTSPPEWTWSFPIIDVTGTTAMVKLELDRDGKRAYTDYLTLYRFEDGWRVMTKLFTAHD